jgi:hypothetical protein
MNTCLFVQWKKPTDASRYVIDGTPSEYSGTELQDKIMKLLAEVPKYHEICSSKDRDDLSPSFRCSYLRSKSSLLHCIEGNFEDLDFAGRKMVYIFITYENDPEKAVNLLNEYSKMLGVHPHQQDLIEIKKQGFKKKSFCKQISFKQTIIWIIIAIIILLLSYMLLNLQSKQ